MLELIYFVFAAQHCWLLFLLLKCAHTMKNSYEVIKTFPKRSNPTLNLEFRNRARKDLNIIFLLWQMLS